MDLLQPRALLAQGAAERVRCGAREDRLRPAMGLECSKEDCMADLRFTLAVCHMDKGMVRAISQVMREYS